MTDPVHPAVPHPHPHPHPDHEHGSEPGSEPGSMPLLAGGRRVSLLPRSGGHAFPATVRDWQAVEDHVVAHVDAEPEAVTMLDHHRVWLSTVSRSGDELGITIFAGKAHAVSSDLLELVGVVRLADERRRTAVRAGSCSVAVHAADGNEHRVAAIDVSRGGVRLPVDGRGWSFPDPVRLSLDLDATTTVHTTGALLRVDLEAGAVILRLGELSDTDAAAIDRFALGRLGRPHPTSGEQRSGDTG